MGYAKWRGRNVLKVIAVRWAGISVLLIVNIKNLSNKMQGWVNSNIF